MAMVMTRPSKRAGFEDVPGAMRFNASAAATALSLCFAASSTS